VLRSWAKDNSDTLVKYLQAYIEGVRWVRDPSNRDEATTLLAERLNLSLDIAMTVYAIVTDKTEGFANDGEFDLEGFKNVLKLRAEYKCLVPAAPKKYLNLSYYRRALAGF
jgi:ABC-type nitrate/sulfonate/bicarbonate transport system substrate-binding protein